MKPRYRLSRDAVELIERFEGFRRKAASLPNGGWTIGFGHTKTAREGALVSREDAEALLLYDLIGVSHVVNEKIFSPLTQNQFDALTAFAFSIGVENFETSAVLRRVNEGQMLAAAYAMEMWRRAPVGGEMIVVDALVRRRAAEKALFLTPQDGVAPSPSPVLPPSLDYDLLTAAPRETPVVVDTPLDGDQASAQRAPTAAPPAPPPTAAEGAAIALGAQLEGLLADSPASETIVEQAYSAEAEELESQPLKFALADDAFLVAPVAEPDPPTEEAAQFEEIEVVDGAPEDLPAAVDEPVPGPPADWQDLPTYRSLVPAGIALEGAAERDPFLLSPPTELDEPEVEIERPPLVETDQPNLFDAQPTPIVTRSLAAADPFAADLRTFRHEDAADFRLKSEDWVAASMLLLGLLLFGGGMVWAMMRTSTSGALVNSTTVGWGVGLIGLALACVGFYRLLQRFLDSGEESSS